MVLQDQQQTIDHVSADPGMEAMVHDFFTPQPIVGEFLFPKFLHVLHRAFSLSSTAYFFSPERSQDHCFLPRLSFLATNRLNPSLTGARSYYLRNVLHNWPNPLARLILQQIRSAMAPSMSRLLINELVVRLQGGGFLAPHQDFNMMSVIAGMERTKAQWEELINSAGLEIKEIWTGEGETESIIEAVVAPANGPEAGD